MKKCFLWHEIKENNKIQLFSFHNFCQKHTSACLLPRIVKYVDSLERRSTPPPLSMTQCSKCSKKLTPCQSPQRQVPAMSCDISKYWFSSRWVDWWGPQRPTRTLWKICNLLTSWKIYIFSLGDAATKYYFSFAFFLLKRLFLLEIIQFC